MPDRGKCMHLVPARHGRTWCRNDADPRSDPKMPRCADHLNQAEETKP